jgi:formylglycine-generating enzyme required for sulfatase activity
MGHEVFVCHSSKDQRSANALVAHLERNEMRCWVAPRDIVPGANLAGVILQAITDSKLMVLVFSEHTNAAPHIRRLLERAIGEGIPVVALRIADVQPSEDLQPLLRLSRQIDAIDSSIEDHLPKVTEMVRRLLKPAPAAGAAAPLPVVPPAVERPLAPLVPTPKATLAPSSRSKLRWAWLTGAAVFGTSVVVGLIILRRHHVSSTAAPRSTSPTAPIAAAQPAFLSPTASRDQRLELLRQLHLRQQLTTDQLQVATQLLIAPASTLSPFDSARLAEINNVLEGRRAADKLAGALDAVEAREQQDGVARAEAAKGARQAEIERLLATSRANDNEDHDTVALAALNECLKLDPNNADAITLREKISQYAPAKQRRMEQEAAAKVAAKAAVDKKAKIDSMIAAATTDANSGRGGDGLAVLEELLKLDPQNAAAVSLREKIGSALKTTNSLGMAFSYIPAGTFVMGSPADESGRSEDETQHKVVLTKGFLMAATPVTQAQWEAVTGKHPSYFQGDNLPVEQVTYDEAVEFCRKLGIKEGKRYRLPTEAEWEYACRAGSTTSYDTGSDGSALGEAGWYDVNSGGQTHPVGQKKPNAWGLFDMHGNVWQWCSDWYGPYPDAELTDPRGAQTVRDRVLRGGSWRDPAERCRSARRRYSASDARYYSIGFRVVLEAQ